MSQSISIDSKFMLYMGRKTIQRKIAIEDDFESALYIYDWTSISIPAIPMENKLKYGIG